MVLEGQSVISTRYKGQGVIGRGGCGTSDNLNKQTTQYLQVVILFFKKFVNRYG